MRNNSRRTFRRSPWLFVAAIVGVLLPLFQSAGFGQRRAAGTTAPKHYVEGELLVKFADDAALRASGRRHSQIGARAVRSFDALGWQQVRLPKGMSVAEGAARYRKLAGVLVAQPNFIYRVAAVPNDPRYGELYGMAKIQAPAAWDQTTGSRAIVVAVIDTGVRYAHEDLAANVWTNPFETPGNGVDDDQNGYVDDVHGADTYDRDGDPLDPHGHGTHVAGTIGAVGHNALGVAGVNWQVSLMVVKIYDATGFGTSASAIGAFEYVAWMRARGINVRVTNNSWGGPPEAAGFDQALKDAIDNCGALGILNVFAAGNDNRDTDAVPFYPASYDSPSILSVAASDQNDNRASFSNYGAASVDLTAPGVGILSTVRTASLYGYSSGTSMASPHVAGAAALLLSRNGALSVAALKAALLNSVDVLPQWASLSATGGRLNVARAAQNITACSFTLDPAGQAFTADGGSGVFNVNTAAGCDWTAASGAPAGWLTVTNGQSGSGAGTVTFTVAPNDTGSARAGALFVAGQVFNVTQAAPPPAPPVPPGSILISEFRIDGPNGPSDEFVEVYHRGDQPLNVATTDGSAGWSIVAGQSFDSNPNALTVLCTVPNGTRLPARGHFLCANVYTDSGGTYRGYSLADYGGTNAAAADTTWHSPGIAADGNAVRFAGLALFATSNPNNFTHSNRLDAVSSTANVSTLFAEGSGLDYAAEYGATAGTQFSWARRLSSGTPQDTNDNAQDFALVSTVGPFSRAGGTLVPATLGAPGPENLASPVQRNGLIKAALLDPFASSAAPPNRARDFAPVANGPLGTLSVRRKFRNHTGQTLSRLRFRVVDLTTAPAPAGTADLRAVGSNAASLVITLSNGTTTVPVLGTQVETPPAQTLLLGGGLNSTLVTIAPAVPLAPGQLVNVEFRFGVGQTGRFRFLVNIEALP